MTALRFQTGKRQQTSPASLGGRGGAEVSLNIIDRALKQFRFYFAMIDCWGAALM